MTRILSALVLIAATVTTLSVAASPARADAVSVTIHASRTTLLEGSSTIISGKAVNAKPGSVVHLQHRSDGSWVTVKSRKTSADRTYAFTISPKRGWQFYRVVKPRQLGQPAVASPRLTLAVQWDPSIVFTSEHVISNGWQWDVIRGTITDGPGTFLPSLQTLQPDGHWATGQFSPSWTDDEHTTFEGSAALADGTVYRLLLGGTALTRAVHSQPATYYRQPYMMSVNSGIHLAELEAGTGSAVVEIDLEADQEVTLVGSDGSWLLHLIDPTGDEVGQVSSLAKFGRLRTGAAGTYEIVVDRSGYLDQMDIWVSEPLVQDVTVGEAAPAVTLLPRQELDVRFVVPADHAVTIDRNSYYEWTKDDAVVDDAGSLQAPLIPARHDGSQSFSHSPVYYSSTESLLTYRYRPDSATVSAPHEPTVYDAPIQDMAVDGAALNAEPEPEGAVALFRYVLPTTGWPPSLSTNAKSAEGYGPLAAWGGAHALLVHDPIYTISVQLLSPLEFNYSLDDPELTVDTTPWFARELILHLALQAGDVVSGTGTVWPENAGILRGPSGELIPRAGNFGSAFIAPVDGDYTYHVMSEHQVEQIGISRATEVVFPTDTPTRFSVDTPDHAAFAWCTAPPGTTVTMDALAADASLGDIWTVGISDPPAFLTHLNSDELSATFTVGPSGRYLVLFDVTADKTGSVTLQQHVVSTP